jgi:hypothetical protein
MKRTVMEEKILQRTKQSVEARSRQEELKIMGSRGNEP